MLDHHSNQVPEPLEDSSLGIRHQSLESPYTESTIPEYIKTLQGFTEDTASNNMHAGLEDSHVPHTCCGNSATAVRGAHANARSETLDVEAEYRTELHRLAAKYPKSSVASLKQDDKRSCAPPLQVKPDITLNPSERTDRDQSHLQGLASSKNQTWTPSSPWDPTADGRRTHRQWPISTTWEGKLTVQEFPSPQRRSHNSSWPKQSSVQTGWKDTDKSTSFNCTAEAVEKNTHTVSGHFERRAALRSDSEHDKSHTVPKSQARVPNNKSLAKHSVPEASLGERTFLDDTGHEVNHGWLSASSVRDNFPRTFDLPTPHQTSIHHDIPIDPSLLEISTQSVVNKPPRRDTISKAILNPSKLRIQPPLAKSEVMPASKRGTSVGVGIPQQGEMSSTATPEVVKVQAAPKPRKRAASTVKTARSAKKVNISNHGSEAEAAAPERRRSKKDVNSDTPPPPPTPAKPKPDERISTNTDGVGLQQKTPVTQDSMQITSAHAELRIQDRTSAMKLRIPGEYDSPQQTVNGDDSIATRRAVAHQRVFSANVLPRVPDHGSSASASNLPAAFANTAAHMRLSHGHSRSSSQASSRQATPSPGISAGHGANSLSDMPRAQPDTTYIQGVQSQTSQEFAPIYMPRNDMANVVDIRQHGQAFGVSQRAMLSGQPLFPSTGFSHQMDPSQASFLRSVQRASEIVNQHVVSGSRDGSTMPMTANLQAATHYVPQAHNVESQLPVSHLELYNQNLNRLRQQPQAASMGVNNPGYGLLAPHNFVGVSPRRPSMGGYAPQHMMQFQTSPRPLTYGMVNERAPTPTLYSSVIQNHIGERYGYHQPPFEVPRPLVTDQHPSNYAGLHWPYYYRTIAVDNGQAFYTFTDDELDILQDTRGLDQGRVNWNMVTDGLIYASRKGMAGAQAAAAQAASRGSTAAADETRSTSQGLAGSLETRSTSQSRESPAVQDNVCASLHPQHAIHDASQGQPL